MRGKTTIALAIALLLSSCSRTTAPESDTGSGVIAYSDTLENVYHIRGILLSNPELYGDSLLISWFATDSTGVFILFDTLYVDTIAIPSPGFQVFVPHYYFPDKVYRLEFKSGNRRAVIYGRTPPTDSVVIISPSSGDTVQAGSMVNIAWKYYPAPYSSDSMHLWFYGEGEATACHHEILPAYETFYQFDTNTCSGYSSIIILPSVLYHNSLEPEGGHPSPLSGAPSLFLFGISGRSVEIYISQ